MPSKKELSRFLTNVLEYLKIYYVKIQIMIQSLEEFIALYDKENAFVLLEGKRNVLEEDKPKLRALGKLLASRTSKMKFRSGNALGADHYFSLGVAEICQERLQVITPYTDHRAKENLAGETFALDTIDLTVEDSIVEQSKYNKKTRGLIDDYVSGDKSYYVKKAAYILRDTVKVIGTYTIPAATFGIFYDDLKKPMEGGTGHTMNICKINNVPYINQTIWFEWLKN